MELISVFYKANDVRRFEAFLNDNDSAAVESVCITADDSAGEILSYLKESESSLVYIFDPDYVYVTDMLSNLASALSAHPEAGISITTHRFADDHFRLIAPPYRAYAPDLFGQIRSGSDIARIVREDRVNIIGSAGCCLFRKEQLTALRPEELLQFILSPSEKNILCSLFSATDVYYMDTILAVRIGKSADEELLKQAYADWSFSSEKPPLQPGTVKKEICFICTDKGEYYNILPLAKEASRRGYLVRIESERNTKCEIGIYCQHICHPQNAVFSVILLHDMLQDYSHWPNLWDCEPWGDFDLGILPGDSWMQRWRQCGALYYANPRLGVYTLGYPKSDTIRTSDHTEHVSFLREKLNFRYNRTVLYAPSWENDNKESDFVNALSSLPINLLIKQAQWNADYDKMLNELREKHESQFDNLYYMEPEESIMTALDLCDIVVSDESNVMIEALLFNKPSISITDWYVPNGKTKQYTSFPMEYAIHCSIKELRQKIEAFLGNKLNYDEYLSQGAAIFTPGGNVCSDIMDAIDYFTGYGEKTDFLKKKLRPLLLPFD